MIRKHENRMENMSRKKGDQNEKLRKQLGNYNRHDFREPTVSSDFKKAGYDIPQFDGQKGEFMNWVSRVVFAHAYNGFHEKATFKQVVVTLRVCAINWLEIYKRQRRKKETEKIMKWRSLT